MVPAEKPKAVVDDLWAPVHFFNHMNFNPRPKTSFSGATIKAAEATLRPSVGSFRIAHQFSEGTARTSSISDRENSNRSPHR
jgi:hypothetical protein